MGRMRGQTGGPRKVMAQSLLGDQQLVMYPKGQYWLQPCSLSSLVSWMIRPSIMGQVCRGHNTEGSSWCSRGLCHHPDRSWQAGEMGGWEPQEHSSWGNIRSCTLAATTLCASEKDLLILEEAELTISQTMCPWHKEAKVIQGSTVRSVTSKLREAILPIFSAVVKQHIECLSPVQGRYGDTGKCSKGP